MYFDFIRNELDRISREQEEKFESNWLDWLKQEVSDNGRCDYQRNVDARNVRIVPALLR